MKNPVRHKVAKHRIRARVKVYVGHMNRLLRWFDRVRPFLEVLGKGQVQVK